MFELPDKKTIKEFSKNNFLNDAKFNPKNYSITLNNIPKSINLKELNNNIVKSGLFKTKYQNKMAYFDTLLFLSNLIALQVSQVRNYMNLSSKIVRRFIDKDKMKKIHTILIDMGIIDKNNYYRVKLESKMYRCHSINVVKNGKKHVLQTFDTQQVTIRSKTCIRRVIKTCIYFRDNPNENIEKIKDNIKSLSIDENEGYRLLNENKGDKKFKKDLLSLIEIIRGNKEPWQTKDRKTGRIFTEVGNMDSRCRDALLLDGERVVEIDLKNCQPMLLTLHYAMLKEDEWGMRAESEMNKLLNIILNEDFYDFLNSKIETPIKSRKKLKKMVFAMMYGGKKTYGTEMFKVFEREFPILAMILISKKYRITAREFAMQLHRFESRIVIGMVFDYLRIHNPEYKIIPIHDAFLVKESEAEAIQEQFERIFYEFTKIKPVLVRK